MNEVQTSFELLDISNEISSSFLFSYLFHQATSYQRYFQRQYEQTFTEVSIIYTYTTDFGKVGFAITFYVPPYANN